MNDDIVPNTNKSNICVKSKRKRTSKRSILLKEKRTKENDIVKDSDIIFGVDNGATGSLACIIPYSSDKIDVYFEETFSLMEDDYQKDVQKISRIDWKKLLNWFKKIIKIGKTNYNKKYNKTDIKISVILERPMINVERFKQSKNAARAFEATLIVLETLNLKENYIVIDSKKWQHYFFGKNTISLDLKYESKMKGLEFLSNFKGKKYNEMIEIINKHGDADSLLISKFAVEKMK